MAIVKEHEKLLLFPKIILPLHPEGRIVNGSAPFCPLKPSQTDHPSIGVAFFMFYSKCMNKLYTFLKNKLRKESNLE